MYAAIPCGCNSMPTFDWLIKLKEGKSLIGSINFHKLLRVFFAIYTLIESLLSIFNISFKDVIVLLKYKIVYYNIGYYN